MGGSGRLIDSLKCGFIANGFAAVSRFTHIRRKRTCYQPCPSSRLKLESKEVGSNRGFKYLYRDMMNLNDVTSSLNELHFGNINEWRQKDMEVDHKRAPAEVELVDEMDVKMSDGERKMYEIYVECCSNDVDKAMEVYLSIMSDVVGGHENAISVLANNMHDINCFLVSLTRSELEKLVEIDNEQIRGIYPPYKPI